MHEGKKSFLLYLDNWEVLAGLGMEQRGWVLTAAYEYAIALSMGEEPEIRAFLRQFPDMAPETRIACGFLCATLGRDNRKWLSQQAARRKKAQERQEPNNQRLREDLERARLLAKELQGE